MQSAGNIYSAEPAVPILAHSLLTKPLEPGNQDLQAVSEPASSKEEPAASDAWNLKYDIDRGIRTSGHTVFRCGKVVGFSRLREKGNDDDSQSVTRLPVRLLTAHLHRNPEGAPSSPNTFIIHPANFEPFSPKALLASLLSPVDSPALSRDEAIKKLDPVQLRPVFDLRAAAQAIGDVSDALGRPGGTEHHVPVVFIIAGLDTLAEGVIRTSNAGKGAAVLTATLRTLTQLSRLHASFLSVMLVNTSGLDTLRPSPAPNPGPGFGGRESRDDSIHSVFRQTGVSLFPSLLLRTLDQGIDTHLLLSSIGNTQVVEVIKDREGGGVGKWSIWE